MGKTYLFNGTQMALIKDKMTKIQKILEKANTDGNRIKAQVDAKTHWKGDAQKTMAGFLDILMQYNHGLVNDKEPVVLAEESLKEFLENLENFYENWDEWKELDRIS